MNKQVLVSIAIDACLNLDEHQVISNLIANSIKFIPPEGGVIYVSLEEDGNKTILVSVKGTGLGIDSENIT